MKSSKLPPLAIAAIGAFICLLLILGMVFGVIQPKNQVLQQQTTAYNAAEPDATTSATDAANAQLASSVKSVHQIRAKWQSDEKALMPTYNISKSRMVAWQELTHELTYYLGPHIEQWIPSTGVVPLFTSVSLAGPPTDPNLITDAPLILPISGGGTTSGSSGGGESGSGGGYPGSGGASMEGSSSGGGSTGSISVGGDYRTILYHIQRWNTFNRLVEIDDLGLHGNSPLMSATYNATVFIFPQGVDNPAPPLPKGPGAAGSSNGAAGMGGGAPGMGGYPGAGGSYPGAGGRAE